MARGTWRDYGSRAGGWPRPLDRYGTAYVELVASAPAAGPVGDRPSRTPTGLRARAGARLERSLPEEAAPLAKALVLAERDDVDPTVTRQFADAGLVHVLAISGLHVGILAAVATWLIGFVTRRASRYLVAAFLVGAYVIFIGSPPSAVRAALLFAGYATARARRAPAATGDLVGLAAIIAVVADPLVVLRPGFQLSYAGFGGLVAGNHAAGRLSAGAVPLSRRLPRRAVAGLRVMLAGTGAFVCTAPIAAAHFGRVSPASILSTPVAVPLVALSLVALFGALLLPSFLADLAADAAAGALTLLRGAVELFGALPLHGPASAPPPFDWLGLGLLFLALGTLVYARTPMRAAVPLGAAFAASAVAPWIAVLPARGATLLCSLDVGQGDAAVIRTRRGRWIVVDAGPGPGFHASTDAGASSYAPERDYRYGDAGRRVVVPFLRARGARAVELFVLSHPHLDHLGGAAGLFEEMPVRRVLDAGYPLASRSYLGFLQRVEAEGAEWLPGRRGARVAIDEVEILVLAPDAEGEARVASAAPPEDPNDVSLIVRMRIDGGFTYLNTGDAPAESETTVLAGWPADSLQAELLKLGHHGSRTSTRLRWLTAVEPRIAVISAGRRNRYGHPHASTLARLDSARIERVWRTDRQGTLCIRVAAGGRWRLEPG